MTRPDPWTTPPPSLQALADHTRDGHWAPGDRHPILETAGRGYGWLIAIPATAVGYSVLWVLQRPTRLAAAALLSGVLYIAWGW